MRYIKSIALNIFNIALKLKERMKLCRLALHFGGAKGCTAQENGGHGWFALMPRNNYVGCIGESSSWA